MRQLVDSNKPWATLLTTEEGKMYNLYILHPDGTTTTLEDDAIYDGWYDHCINPKLFRELAKKHGCGYTRHCYHYIIEQYNQNYLNIENPMETSLDGVRITFKETETGIIYAHNGNKFTGRIQRYGGDGKGGISNAEAYKALMEDDQVRFDNIQLANQFLAGYTVPPISKDREY